MTPSWKSLCIQYRRSVSISIASSQCFNHVHILTVGVILMSYHQRTLNSTDSARFSNAMAWLKKIHSLSHYTNHCFSTKQRQTKIHFVTQLLVLSYPHAIKCFALYSKICFLSQFNRVTMRLKNQCVWGSNTNRLLEKRKFNLYPTTHSCFFYNYRTESPYSCIH
jgi:hypothetical protein